MEGTYAGRISAPEMFQKPQTLSFLGRRSFVPRPLSSATEIFDSDDEDGSYDSPASLDTASTLSSLHEIATPPLTGGLGGFTFRIDEEMTSGPYGPHLFDRSLEDDEEIFISISPAATTPKASAPRRNIVSLNTAVAQLDEASVRSWSPEQVAEWMTDAGFDSTVVDKFLIHDICGTVLLDLQFEDLKELDISSFGKRRQVMTSIQRLRDSTVPATPISRSSSRASRSESVRRGRHNQALVEDILPAESVSIVAIEQVLPKLHKCSKGEDCAKWQKQQRKIQKLEEQLAADTKSIAAPSVIAPSVVAPSVVASSDILGPSQGFTITSERLNAIEPRDPLDNVRNFLSFQHVNSPTTLAPPSGPAIAPKFKGLPKLTIPTENKDSESPFHTPISAFRNPTEYQAQLRAELQQDPYHYGGVASPVDVYRVGTPASVTDLPLTAIPIDPCQREISHSVPPEMKYGRSMIAAGESIDRPSTTQPSTRHPRRPSFVPAMSSLRENCLSPGIPPVTSEADLAGHSGWMRQRKTTRLMKHEWNNQYCTLEGTQLGIAKDEATINHDAINVDEYTLHAYSTASSSKLSAAFKKSMKSASTEPTFAFTLIPEAQTAKKFFEKDRSHHFAVNSGKDRVEWMRKLMLAKAMKKNDGQI